jgi:hypothetical protein
MKACLAKAQQPANATCHWSGGICGNMHLLVALAPCKVCNPVTMYDQKRPMHAFDEVTKHPPTHAQEVWGQLSSSSTSKNLMHLIVALAVPAILA